MIIAGELSKVIAFVYGTAIKFIPGIVIPGANIGIGLTHLLIVRFLIFGKQFWSVSIDDFVLGMGKINICPYSPIGAKLLIEFQFDFITFIFYLSEVGRWGLNTEIGGNRPSATRDKYIRPVIFEEVYFSGNLSVEQSKVHAEV
ncbi:hypothetical protein D3C86_1200980 [compost metagenome]